jgi:hypothetical protein
MSCCRFAIACEAVRLQRSGLASANSLRKRSSRRPSAGNAGLCSFALFAASGGRQAATAWRDDTSAFRVPIHVSSLPRSGVLSPAAPPDGPAEPGLRCQAARWRGSGVSHGFRPRSAPKYRFSVRSDAWHQQSEGVLPGRTHGDFLFQAHFC